MSVVLKALTAVLDKKYEVLCLSTEEMQFHMNEFNKNESESVNPVVFSTDFEKFYSSFDIPAMTSIIANLSKEKKLMLSMALEKLMRVSLENHMYEFK